MQTNQYMISDSFTLETTKFKRNIVNLAEQLKSRISTLLPYKQNFITTSKNNVRGQFTFINWSQVAEDHDWVAFMVLPT